MFIQPFFVKGIAHSSYLLGCSTECAIIDPQRDVQIYIDAAKSMGMKITHILETHLHADFISGHMDLAKATGAAVVAPASGKCAFPHKAVKEGDTFRVQNIEIRVLDTPGHTPEHISYVVTDRSRGTEPTCVFCGDTLFVGDVGRPDLFPGQAVELATKLYDNLHDKLLKLPDYCEVYPAHGAGSLCGRAMGAKRMSTIGYEKLYNKALLIKDKQQFIASLTTNMPPAPDHFSRCSATNGKGPALTGSLPAMEELAPAAFKKESAKTGTIVLDIRGYDAFGGQHVPGAYHIDLAGNFATFAGWMLPADARILLVANSPQDAKEAAVWLRRVGLDNVAGYLSGGMSNWAKEGLPTAHVDQLSVHELRDMAEKGSKMVLVDVRAPAEYEHGHIEGAVNIPAPALRARFKELDANTPVTLICSTGNRSSMASSILKQHGFKKVSNVSGGMTGYAAAGFAPACAMCVAPHVPLFMGT